MRKQPRQARARQRVDALIDAAAQEIADRGLLETTTNHIAARAGVSIGSLYQYFEDKNDLVTMLVRRLSSEIAEAAQATLATSIAADVHTVVRQLLGTALNMVDERPALYLELARNWQMQGTLTVIESLETHLMDAWGRYLLHHHDELAVTNLPAALFVVINSTLFTIMRYLSLPDPGFNRNELIDALSDMIASYARSAWGRNPDTNTVAD